MPNKSGKKQTIALEAKCLWALLEMPETKVIVNKRLNLSDYFQLYLKICTENDFFSLPLQHKNKDYGRCESNKSSSC